MQLTQLRLEKLKTELADSQTDSTEILNHPNHEPVIRLTPAEAARGAEIAIGGKRPDQNPPKRPNIWMPPLSHPPIPKLTPNPWKTPPTKDTKPP